MHVPVNKTVNHSLQFSRLSAQHWKQDVDKVETACCFNVKFALYADK